eukprot:TRINITY_DN2504_c0_g1_i1.p1 TRINITY_DN2504_c0_g1~~TRINITY_DN2504_c0_g1_i1.p1  ORF type:complete len:131 (-),score=37.64 TRINITY_DN2504_c0_g1_i1:94-441(-)
MNISRAVSRLSSFARPAGSSATRIVARQPTSGVVARAYAGGKSEHAGHEGEYGDLVIPHVESWHKHAAYAIGTTFWLWIFWRFKHDWKATLGVEHPWDAHGSHDEHEHDDDEHHH